MSSRYNRKLRLIYTKKYFYLFEFLFYPATFAYTMVFAIKTSKIIIIILIFLLKNIYGRLKTPIVQRAASIGGDNQTYIVSIYIFTTHTYTTRNIPHSHLHTDAFVKIFYGIFSLSILLHILDEPLFLPYIVTISI